MSEHEPVITTRQGHPVHNNQQQRTVGSRGPATLENYRPYVAGHPDIDALVAVR